MQDRCWKACRGGELRIRVQRIPITTHPVQQSLLWKHRRHHCLICFAIRKRNRLRRTTFTPETTLAAGENGRASCPQRVALGVDRDGFLHDHRGLALVPDLGDSSCGAGHFHLPGSADGQSLPGFRAPPSPDRFRRRGTTPSVLRWRGSWRRRWQRWVVPEAFRRRGIEARSDQADEHLPPVPSGSAARPTGSTRTLVAQARRRVRSSDQLAWSTAVFSAAGASVVSAFFARSTMSSTAR